MHSVFKTALFGLLSIISLNAGTPSYGMESCGLVWNYFQPDDYLYNIDKDPISSAERIPKTSPLSYQNYLHRLQTQEIERKNCLKKWTVLIYMGVTSDLEPYAYADLIEMEAAGNQPGYLPGSSLRTDVLVQTDFDSTRESRRFHIFRNNNESVLHLTQSDLKELSFHHVSSPLVSYQESFEVGSAAHQMTDFIQWGIKEYPSENYLFIFWGHSRGWTAFRSNPDIASGQAMGGMIHGENLGYIDLITFKTILDHFSQASSKPSLKTDLKLSAQKPLPILACDSCLFQSVDTIAELSDQVQWITGSEAIESYAGYPYGHLLSHLNLGEFEKKPFDPDREAHCVACMIPSLYKKSFRSTKSQADLDPVACDRLTSSSVHTETLRTSLIPSLNQLGLALNQYIDENPLRKIGLKFLITGGETFQGGTRDLGLFFKKLKRSLTLDRDQEKPEKTPAEIDLDQALTQANDALRTTVISCALGENYAQSPPLEGFEGAGDFGPRGLSIWLPSRNEDFFARLDDFSQSPLFATDDPETHGGWKSWLMRMYVQKKY